jgi:hypothetical protein
MLCVPAVEAPGQARNGGILQRDASALDGIYTPQIMISDHPHHVLMGHVIIVARGEETVRALVIRQRRDGVHRLRYRAAWSGGTELPWRRSYGQRCTHGHCRDRPVGMIFVSAPLFVRGLDLGLSARLTGPDGAIDIHAPAALFRDAAARLSAR